MKKFDKEYFQNGFNWIHFQGGGLTDWLLFFIFESSLIKAFLFAQIPTLIKETIDQIARKYQIEWLLKIGFDRAGWDTRDCIMALIGSIIAALIILIKGIV